MFENYETPVEWNLCNLGPFILWLFTFVCRFMTLRPEAGTLLLTV
jgi:hypothetical protein